MVEKSSVQINTIFTEPILQVCDAVVYSRPEMDSVDRFAL